MFNDVEFKKIKSDSETFYKSVGKIKCPALGTEINFTSDGFHHLRYDNTRAERSKNEQKNKMICLSEAVDILKRTTTIQEYRLALQAIGKPGQGGFRKTTHAEYYAFSAIVNIYRGIRIRVVVRRIGDGLFHFWSLMPFCAKASSI